MLEDFHGTAEAIVFPDAWAKLNQSIRPDAALLLTGGYSDRDRGEDRAPFIVESARPLAEIKSTGALALSLRWRAPSAPRPDAVRAAAALCAAHPGPTPVYIEWSDGNGESVRLRVAPPPGGARGRTRARPSVSCWVPMPSTTSRRD